VLSAVAAAGFGGSVLERRLGALFRGLRGTPIPRCAVHGDFWRGNVAFDGSQLRVHDWEWAQPEGSALFDPATWEFGALHAAGHMSDPEAVQAAVNRIADRFEKRGIPRRFGAAALAYAAAELAVRTEREFGRRGQAAGAATKVLTTLGGLMEDDTSLWR
jgi:aminoglycoside phosphotransferase (APT) family kinase protein